MSPKELDDLQKINIRLDKFEDHQNYHHKELQGMRDDMDQLLIKTGKIHSSLIGTEYNPKGGITQRISKVECEQHKLNKWKIKITAVGATITTLFGLIIAYFQMSK